MNMPPHNPLDIPDFLKRNKETTMQTQEPQQEKKKRLTATQRIRREINAEIMSIDIKLSGMKPLQDRKAQLEAALNALPSDA